MKKLALCFVLLGSVFCRAWGQPADDLDLSTFIHPVDSSAFVRDAGYYHVLYFLSELLPEEPY